MNPVNRLFNIMLAVKSALICVNNRMGSLFAEQFILHP